MIEAVNGESVLWSTDPYDHALELIESAGRPVGIRFIAAANAADEATAAETSIDEIEASEILDEKSEAMLSSPSLWTMPSMQQSLTAAEKKMGNLDNSHGERRQVGTTRPSSPKRNNEITGASRMTLDEPVTKSETARPHGRRAGSSPSPRSPGRSARRSAERYEASGNGATTLHRQDERYEEASKDGEELDLQTPVVDEGEEAAKRGKQRGPKKKSAYGSSIGSFSSGSLTLGSFSGNLTSAASIIKKGRAGRRKSTGPNLI